ncbi:MAG: hypothetical protein ABH952_07025 [Candidatus Omnitrophota bacterium]
MPGKIFNSLGKHLISPVIFTICLIISQPQQILAVNQQPDTNKHLRNIAPNHYIKLSIDSSTHRNYGLAYPITHTFSLPATFSALKAYKRHRQTQPWREITEKTSRDFFNGIEAVRFDYLNNIAYISLSFDCLSDEIHLKILDSSGKAVNATYQGISDYYDNRDAAIVATADDWDGYEPNNTGFKMACDAFTQRKIWLTVGITTHGQVNLKVVPHQFWSAVIWDEVQSKVDAGYIEVASHSLTHPGPGCGHFYKYTGPHTGTDNQRFVLEDKRANNGMGFPSSDKSYLVGLRVKNTTDKSSGIITSNTNSTITCAAGLSGGTGNCWNKGDTYSISLYDSEIGTSKDEIITNLNLPYAQGSNEYVYAWFEPCCYSDHTVLTKLGQFKYLVDRNSIPGAQTFAPWSQTPKIFGPTGCSLWIENSALAAANKKFDNMVSRGNIYHICMHPRDVDWSDDSWIYDHLNYIHGRTNLWYVGLGHLYLYHYVNKLNKITVEKIAGE